jgi:hypothetical protein
MHGHWHAIGVRIEPGDIACGLMETHPAVNGCHFLECSVDGAMRIRNGQAAHAYAHKRSQQRLSTLNGRIL